MKRDLRIPGVAASAAAAAALAPRAFPQEPPATAPAASQEAAAESSASGLDVDGYLDLRYRYRSVPGEFRDQDLFDTVGARATFPGVGRDGLRVNLSGSCVGDLDEFQEARNPFNGLPETFGRRFHPYLYEAYGEFDPGGDG